MSPGPLPEYADASLAFTHGDRISASVTLQQLQRFRQYLLTDDSPEDETSIRVELGFVMDESGSRLVTGELSGTVRLQCQRCLQPVLCPVEAAISLLVVDSDEDARMASKEHEVVITSLREGHKVLELLPLVEDELILALPSVPMHDAGECSAGQGSGERTRVASGGIAGRDADMLDKLRQLRDDLARKNQG